MSLVVTVYVPSGIVMAADSRITGARREEKKEGEQTIIVERQIVVSDNAYKVVSLTKVPVGIGAFGTGVINDQTVDTHIRAFEEERAKGSDSVVTIPQKLVSYFQQRFPNVLVGFFVAGFRQENGITIPYVYAFDTVKQPVPKRINISEEGKIQYGVLRGGDTSVIDRLIAEQFKPLFAAMPLQDAIDYAIYLIRTTIDTLRFEPRFPSVGGDIDVLAMTPGEGPHFIQRKELHGD
jgi:hypothetical protein